MNKTKAIGISVISLIILVGLVFGAIFLMNKDKQDSDTTSQSDPGTATTSESEQKDPALPTPATTVTTQSASDYVGSQSDAGICKTMQEIVQKEIFPLQTNSGYGQLNKQSQVIAKKANKLIKESGEEKTNKGKAMKDLISSMEQYSKYAGDLNATQSQIIQTANNFQMNISKSKEVCNWK